MLDFEQFIAIDWSGAVKPFKTHTISLAHCTHTQDAPQAIPKALSRQDIFDYLSEKLTQAKPCLVGIDANFSYTHNIFNQQLANNYTIFTLWQKIV